MDNLKEIERLERINAGLIARLCGTFVASRWTERPTFNLFSNLSNLASAASGEQSV